MLDELEDVELKLVGDGLLYFNGVNGTTGGYLIPPMSAGELAEVIKSQAADLDQKEKKRLELQDRIERNKKSLGWSYKVKKEDPKSAGWGVVFHRDEDQAVKEAIAPLIERRRKQLGAGSLKPTAEVRRNRRG